MPISQANSLNLTALLVPDLYVQIVVPSESNLNGVPTNVLGIDGTATWGPVNSPTTAGNLAQASAVFGPLQARKYDLLTQVALAQLQGANNFKLVRVTDGTDVAATIVVLTNCITYTSKYTGSFGNGIVVTASAGSLATSFRIVVSAPGLVPETFDNIGAGLSGNALWLAIAAAINNGTNTLRGPSNIIVATAGVGTTAVASASYTLASGTDGATTITGSVLIGQDTVPRKGMYALRNSGASVAVLADCDDSTTWSTQVAYGLSEGTLMVGTGPSGDTISNALSTKTTAGIDSYAMKLCFGDYLIWLDSYNSVTRAVSPHGAVAGLLVALSPNESPLNKQIQGIAGTQKSLTNQVYSSADLQQLVSAGIDLVCNPCPGGSYFGVRFGHNTSSNPLIHGDNYTRMTNYIAATINAGMGKFVGELNNLTEESDALAAVSAYFDNLQLEGLIGTDPNGPPAYSIQLNANNNPQTRTALGYQQIDCQVQYTPIVEDLLISVQGGASVTITRQNVQLA